MYNLTSSYQSHLKACLKRTEYLILSILVAMIQNDKLVILEELASKFPQKILFESRRRKIQRFLSLPQLNFKTIWFPLFTAWLAREFEPKEVLYIAIDRTQWSSINLLVISLIYQRRAIPIYFELLPRVGCCNCEQQKAALSKVLPLLTPYITVVLGDREFCSVDLASWLRKQPQTYFCLRLRRSEYVEVEQEWVQLKNLGLAPGISLYLEGVKVTKTKGFIGGNIACKWQRSYRGAVADEAWFILTNLLNLSPALSAYKKRFGIEEMFRDFKSGGYNLEKTGVQGDRLIALILLITLAYSSAIFSGEQIKKKGQVKYVGRIKEPRRQYKRHSDFYIGAHGLSWVKSLQFFSLLSSQLMALSPHKRPYYQRGRRAEKLIISTFQP
ncbi:MAG TPA: IS4 family transposase [Cyanobacteria bacterium UBA11369]|nr:IS4 family transposase [Cyanobacteria bacterium UBA11371]HBE35939.1 IS4 family transposase [Cyanobacteria bacterium UBA11368]HBE47874.1 IS4 family transposase [Cyanobacteria bacterium UBA11369]